MTIAGADCHAHVFNPKRFPYRASEIYTPHPSQEGTPAKFLAVLDAHGLSHALLVGANPYGHDNSCLLDAIANSNQRFKGIALVPHNVSEAEIARLKAGGVVGTRLNLFNQGLAPLTDPTAPALLAKLKEADWFAQIQCKEDQLAEVMPILQKSGVRVMIDHCGRPSAKRGVQQKGFQALLELGRSGNHVVKLSGAFRFSEEPYPHRDADPFIAALADAFTLERCVWGSDWPFVRMDERMDYGPGFANLARWFPDANDRRKILADTPASLFGFR